MIGKAYKSKAKVYFFLEVIQQPSIILLNYFCWVIVSMQALDGKKKFVA